MIKIEPSTLEADIAILKSVADHPKIYKPGLLMHAACEIAARHKGFASYAIMKQVQQAEAEAFMRDLREGKVEE